MPDLSIFKIDSQTINIKDTTARQTADSAKTLATTASGNATTALNKINELESEKADKTLATTSANGLMSAADKKAVDREFFKLLPKGGTIIPNGANLNSTAYLKVGNYYQHADVNTTNMTNIPIKSAFMMYVLSPLSEDYDNESTAQWVYRLRIFVAYTGTGMFVQSVFSDATPGNFSYGPWIKMTNSNDLGAALNKINKLESEKADKTLATASANGLMSAADKKAVDREFFRMLPKGGTHIPANADLNSIQYIKVGNYYNGSNTESETIKNIPVANAFMMYVLSPLSGAYDNESTAQWVYRLRIFVAYTGTGMFVQSVFSDATPGNFSYGPWIKMTNSNDLGAALNKINKLEKLSRVSISYDSTKENMTITIGTHSVA